MTAAPRPQPEQDPAKYFELRLRTAIAMIRVDSEHAARIVREALDYLNGHGSGQASFDAAFDCSHDEIEDGILGFDGLIGGTCRSCRTPVIVEDGEVNER